MAHTSTHAQAKLHWKGRTSGAKESMHTETANTFVMIDELERYRERKRRTAESPKSV